MQQIMAYETDILEFEDIFDGSPVIAAKVAALKTLAYDEITKIDGMGGAVMAVENAYMKQELVKSNVNRMQRIERDEQAVIGVNRFTTTEISPLTTGEGTIMVVDPKDEAAQIHALQMWRSQRDNKAVSEALEALRQAALKGENIMPPSIAAAKAGVTTGEWADVLREIYGEYRAPTGVSPTAAQGNEDLDELREKVGALSLKLGRRPKFLVGKPGLDGHSNGAEQIATRARDIGMDVVYDGIRLTPEAIVQSALKEKAHLIGLSILSGSHVALARDILRLIDGKIPVIVGGIIPESDALLLKNAGVAAVYTPKDFKMNDIMADIIDVMSLS
jgi:(2R)-ethylmalonyl-CoA mutase